MNDVVNAPRATEPGSLIGKRITKLDAPEKASGKTRYVHDIALPGQLHAAILRSARVHARIVRIDTSRAARAARRARGADRRRHCRPTPDRRRQGPSAAEERPRAQHARRDCRGGRRERGHRSRGIEADRGRVRGPARRDRCGGRSRARRAADPPADRRCQGRGTGGPGRQERQPGDALRLRPWRRRRRRGRVRRGGRRHLRAALRDTLLPGRLGRARRVRRQRQPAAVFQHPGAVPAQARVRRDAGHGPGAHPHHPAADRRRLRQQARHLSVRGDLRLPRARHRAAGEAGVHARGGVPRVADPPAGAPDPALGLHTRRHADLPHRAHAARQRRLHLVGGDHAVRDDADLLFAVPRAELRLPHAGRVHEQPVCRVVSRLWQPAGHVRRRGAHGQAGGHHRHGSARVPAEERAGARRSHRPGHGVSAAAASRTA